MAKVYLRVPKNNPNPTRESVKNPPKIKLKVKKQEPIKPYNEYEKDIDNNLPTYDKNTRDFFKYYLNSPLYKQRLIGQGYNNPDDATSLRLANLNVTKTEKKYSPTSEYDQPGQKVYISPYDYLSNQRFNPKSITAHELSHVVGALHPLTPKFPAPMTMNNKEFQEIYNRNKLSRLDESKLSPEQKLHDRNPHENKADIDTLRYMLYSDGIYDAGKQKFNKEVLQKAKLKYNSDAAIKRLFDNFSDDDIIWIMNNIAMNKKSDNNIA